MLCSSVSISATPWALWLLGYPEAALADADDMDLDVGQAQMT
jgi:hypothetical protein